MFYQIGFTKRFKGVGFFVKSWLIKRIVEVKGISEWIAVLKLKINEDTIMTLIQVYAPTMRSGRWFL